MNTQKYDIQSANKIMKKRTYHPQKVIKTDSNFRTPRKISINLTPHFKSLEASKNLERNRNAKTLIGGIRRSKPKNE